MIRGGPLFENNIARRIVLLAKIANEQEALRIRLIQQQHMEERIRLFKKYAWIVVYAVAAIVAAVYAVAIMYSIWIVCTSANTPIETEICLGDGPFGCMGIRGLEGIQGPPGYCANPPKERLQ